MKLGLRKRETYSPLYIDFGTYWRVQITLGIWSATQEQDSDDHESK